MTEPTVRDRRPEDDETLLEINAANVPEVGPMDRAKLTSLAEEAAWFPVLELDGRIAGFAIFLTEGAAYASPNYRWFGERHTRYIYVDRIALTEGARGRGVGRRLYGEAVERARSGGRPVFCAEVNTIPPNPTSMRFHERFGFAEVDRRSPYDPDSEVAMLELRVSEA
ncbi:MAG: GNAT family N-acetyltransferase [Planctomycetota bacterium]